MSYGIRIAEGERKMDANRFAALSRQVGAAPSRRAAVGILAAGLTGALLVGKSAEEAEAGIPIVNCKVPGKKCSNNQKCCTGRCRKKRCTCARKGHPCWDPLEGALCCSGRCQSGRCQ